MYDDNETIDFNKAMKEYEEEKTSKILKDAIKGIKGVK